MSSTEYFNYCYGDDAVFSSAHFQEAQGETCQSVAELLSRCVLCRARPSVLYSKACTFVTVATRYLSRASTFLPRPFRYLRLVSVLALGWAYACMRLYVYACVSVPSRMTLWCDFGSNLVASRSQSLSTIWVHCRIFPTLFSMYASFH